MDRTRVDELLYQAFETELVGVQVCEMAIRCAVNDDLRREWREYFDETRNHVSIARQMLSGLNMDPQAESTGRSVVRFKGEALLRVMEMALESGDATAAQIVAAEAVVDVETKDHANWALIAEIGKVSEGELAVALVDAYEQVGEEKDRHLYHTMGWARELWMESLELPALLPPPEQRRNVTSAIGASRAEQGRDEMIEVEPSV